MRDGQVNGHCITGGFELALACDILVGSSAASFRDTHVKFGLAPCWWRPHRCLPAVSGNALPRGSHRARQCLIRRLGVSARGLSQKLPRLIGATRAALVSYTAGKIDAKIASDWGLLARVTAPEHLMEEAVKIAGTIAQNDARPARPRAPLLVAAPYHVGPVGPGCVNDCFCTFRPAVLTALLCVAAWSESTRRCLRQAFGNPLPRFVLGLPTCVRSRSAGDHREALHASTLYGTLALVRCGLGRLSLGEGLSQERLAAKQHYAGMQDQLFGTGWKSKL